MTLEGIGIVIDPDYNFFEIARPFAKEFMLKREARHFRNLIVGRLMRGEDGGIQWGKIWKLAKMALKMSSAKPRKRHRHKSKHQRMWLFKRGVNSAEFSVAVLTFLFGFSLYIASSALLRAQLSYPHAADHIG